MRKRIISIGLVLAMVLFCIHFIRKNVFISMVVPSESMETTIMVHDCILGNRLAYRSGRHPQRGDIVIFPSPFKRETLLVKRVIGLPGEKLVIKNGKVYADGVELRENYLNHIPWGKGEKFTYQIPTGHYFMMGDNRNHSIDSRYWPEKALKQGLTKKEALKYAFVSQKKIMAKVLIRQSFKPNIYR